MQNGNLPLGEFFGLTPKAEAAPEMIFGEFGAPLMIGDMIVANEGMTTGTLKAIDGDTVEIDLGDGVLIRLPGAECSPFDQS